MTSRSRNRAQAMVAVCVVVCMTAPSCRQRKSEPSTPASSGDSGAETQAPTGPAKASPGAYDCTLEAEDVNHTIEQCEVLPTQEIHLAGPTATLEAALVPKDYGFALEGTLRLGAVEHVARAELFRQGAGSFAAVLPLGERGQPIVRLTMVPKTRGTPTAR